MIKHLLNIVSNFFVSENSFIVFLLVVLVATFGTLALVKLAIYFLFNKADE